MFATASVFDGCEFHHLYRPFEFLIPLNGEFFINLVGLRALSAQEWNFVDTICTVYCVF